MELNLLMSATLRSEMLSTDCAQRARFHGRWQYLFIESICNDPAVLEQNYRYKMMYSPDYAAASEHVRCGLAVDYVLMQVQGLICSVLGFVLAASRRGCGLFGTATEPLCSILCASKPEQSQHALRPAAPLALSIFEIVASC